MARRAFNNDGMEEKKGPTFFKIIKTGFNTDDLRIPPKFRKNLLNELSERATLNLNDSSNCSWTVEVSQTEGEIYFKNGWQKFIRDNSLGNYEFLVFRYERDMQFSIDIFDSTACKRTKFPDVRTHRGQGRAKKCDTSGIHIRSCQSNKLKEVKEEEEDYQDNKEEEAATLPNLEFPAFTSIIGRGLYNVAVPTDFSRNYLPQGYYTVILKNSEGREWKVSIVPSANTVKLSGGWAAFRCDNQINSGDICTFELVRRETMVVHIVHMQSHFATLLISLRSLIGWKWRHAAAFIAFCSGILAIWTVELAQRSISYLDTMARRASTSHNGGVEEKKKPTFFKIIKPGFNTEHLRIPPAFLKHVVHDLTKRATLKLKNSSNCSWTVKVSTTGRDVYLKDGWQKFLRDNSLGDSEFLQFRYVRNMNFIVTIFDKNCVERVNIADIRTHEASTFPDKTKRRLGRPPIGNRRYDSAKEAAKVLKCKGGYLPSSAAAASFKSKFPYFVKVLKGWQKVAIPTHFYMEILSSSGNCDELILVTSEGKFTVTLVRCSDTVMLSAGWSAFRDVNQLQVNDICIFELVKENTMVVHIFPN